MPIPEIPLPDGGDSEPEDTLLCKRRYGEGRDASLGVIDAVAEIEGIDPIDVGTDTGATLQERIDPKALDTIVGGGEGTGTTIVEFLFLRYLVRVDDAGRIQVFERP
jgi:hypothetical protein